MSTSLLQISGSERITLDNRGYRLLKKLGEGSFAKVYLGEFQMSKSAEYYKLACKIIDTKKTPDQYKKKFLSRELNVLANCSHPHLVAIHSIFKRHDKFFVFMRYAERGDLYDVVRANGAVGEQQAKIWIRQMSLAIQYLHLLDIAHRDLKVENVLVTENYNTKLSDYGFARSCVDGNGDSVWSETFCGSLAYVAPEILKGNPYRPKMADMWSFGVLIYTMLNKANPFTCTDMATLYRYQINKNWKFREFMKSHLSEEIKQLVHDLMEPDVVKRLNIDDVLRNPLLDVPPTSEQMRTSEERALSVALDYRRRKQSMKREESLLAQKVKSREIKTMEPVSVMDIKSASNADMYVSKEQGCHICADNRNEKGVQFSIKKASVK